ncbi:MAG: hypothetical protein WCG47_10050, partial [Dermatophilaceae bacterium]
CYVIGVNPCVRVEQIPADFPGRERVWRTDPEDPQWVEPGNTVVPTMVAMATRRSSLGVVTGSSVSR